MMPFQTTERETRKRLRLLFFSVISFPFPYLFFGPLFPSLWFQKQSPCPRLFYILPPLSVPFLYFVSLSKLLSTSPKSHLFPFCFTLFSLSYSFLFLHSLLFSDSSSVFDGVLPYYGGAAIVGGTASGDRTLVPSGGEKKGSLLLFFPSVQRHQFLLFLHDCCNAARRGKKMARG